MGFTDEELQLRATGEIPVPFGEVSDLYKQVKSGEVSIESLSITQKRQLYKDVKGRESADKLGSMMMSYFRGSVPGMAFIPETESEKKHGGNIGAEMAGFIANPLAKITRLSKIPSVMKHLPRWLRATKTGRIATSAGLGATEGYALTGEGEVAAAGGALFGTGTAYKAMRGKLPLSRKAQIWKGMQRGAEERAQVGTRIKGMGVRPQMETSGYIPESKFEGGLRISKLKSGKRGGKTNKKLSVKPAGKTSLQQRLMLTKPRDVYKQYMGLGSAIGLSVAAADQTFRTIPQPDGSIIIETGIGNYKQP